MEGSIIYSLDFVPVWEQLCGHSQKDDSDIVRVGRGGRLPMSTCPEKNPKCP